jgi:hypothetical protein
MRLIPLLLLSLAWPLTLQADDAMELRVGQLPPTRDLTAEPVYRDFTLGQKIYRQTESRALSRAAVVNRSESVEFEIFNAWVTTHGDLDYDGYFHHISIGFDADVNSDVVEAVYAKLYLSRDGGPWFLFSTTELYEIEGNDGGDIYEIYGELVDGFQPGYYSVLIELHSLYHPGIVSERQVDLDDYGQPIALEDTGYDEPYTEVYIEQHHHTGGLNLMGILVLGGLWLLKKLQRPAMSEDRPPKQGENSDPKILNQM